jgi:histidinol-phosphate aminotransferase
MHGGDIYRNNVTYDFSVNGNPYGIPPKVKEALQGAVERCTCYPDLRSEQLTKKLAESLQVAEECILCGNGASELFLAVTHALQPKKAMLPVPSFSGYEHVLRAIDCKIEYWMLKEQEQFLMTADFLEALTEEIEILFLTNPNNPTGSTIAPGLLTQILDRCLESHITVVLDECFIEFTQADTMISKLWQYPNLIVVRAFTKIYALPGVRLGYLVSANPDLITAVKKHLPEWNLSVFAQEAGIAALEETKYIEQSRQQISRLRQELSRQLGLLGLRVYPSEANYLLCYSEQDLYEPLLKQGILIRDCSDYAGLTKGYYRMAVRKKQENDQLLKAIQRFIEIERRENQP